MKSGKQIYAVDLIKNLRSVYKGWGLNQARCHIDKLISNGDIKIIESNSTKTR